MGVGAVDAPMPFAWLAVITRAQYDRNARPLAGLRTLGRTLSLPVCARTSPPFPEEP